MTALDALSEYPSDILLGMLRVGAVSAELFAWPSTSWARWFDPTPECVHCAVASVVALVSWRTHHFEVRPVLSQAALELGPAFDDFPIGHEELCCAGCVYAVIADAAADPLLDRSEPITVEVSYWWLKRDRAGGVG